MERAQLQPSRSAPDLTDLLEARSFGSHNRLNDTSDDDAAAQDIEDDEDGNEDDLNDADSRHWRRNHLPTPSPSRSPTPEVSRSFDGDYGGTRGGHARMQRGFEVDDDEDAYDDRYHGNVLVDSQIISESDDHTRPSREDSLSPGPGTSNSGSRTRGLSNVGTRFLPATLWDYLREELGASELDGSQEMKAERVTNFFAVPMAVEQVRSKRLSVAIMTISDAFSNPLFHEDHHLRLFCLLGFLSIYFHNPTPSIYNRPQKMGSKLFQTWQAEISTGLCQM